MSSYFEYYCKGCGELVECTNEVGLCEYCQDLMEEYQNESLNRRDSSRREAEEGE